MHLSVDPAGPFTLAQQIISQIRARIIADQLLPGDPLPSARALAEQLGVNINTVAQAYRQLENEGYLQGRKRAGTRVSDDPPRPLPALLTSQLTAPLAAALRALGLDPGEAATLLAAQCAAGAAAGATAGAARVAVLARDRPRAQQLARAARPLFGADVLLDAQTPGEYVSARYHLTLIDPELSRTLERGLRAEAAPPPPADYGRHSADFPAGAD